jgi:hypothetical protein
MKKNIILGLIAFASITMSQAYATEVQVVCSENSSARAIHTTIAEVTSYNQSMLITLIDKMTIRGFTNISAPSVSTVRDGVSNFRHCVPPDFHHSVPLNFHQGVPPDFLGMCTT